MTATPQFDARTQVSRRERVIAERLLDEIVMLDPEGGAYALLNPTGRWIWERLAAPQRLDALSAELAAEFGLDEARALADVMVFVAELAQRGFVEAHPPDRHAS